MKPKHPLLVFVAAALAIPTAGGCASDPINAAPVVAPDRPATTDDAGTTQRPVARVNGRTIHWTDFQKRLLETHGLTILQQMIAVELVADQADRVGVAVTEEEINAEYARQLDRVYPLPHPTRTDDDRRRQERAIAAVLARQGLTLDEFHLKVRRDVYLQKLAQRELVVTEDDLQREFRILHGPRVSLQIIVCRARRDVD